jgi:hypothetical protein
MNKSGGNSRPVWAHKIKAAWSASIADIIETGKLIAAAKDDLPHGQFETMVEKELPFGARTARMLVAVGKDSRFRNHGSVLPASWRTLYELTLLTDDQFQRGIATGDINAEITRVGVARLRGITPGALPLKPSRTITAAVSLDNAEKLAAYLKSIITIEEFEEFRRFWEARIRTDRDLREFAMHLKIVLLQKQIEELAA